MLKKIKKTEGKAYAASTNRSHMPHGAADAEEIEDLVPLKDIYIDQFMIGTAGGTNELHGIRLEFLIKHFNALTPENSMKPESLQPVKGVFTFAEADELVRVAREHDITVIGHTLVWHQQTPAWMNVDVSRDEALNNMDNHISVVMNRWKDQIYSWDVLNEAIIDGATTPSDWKSALRNSPWLQAIGDDYVEISFLKSAEEEPDTLLYYNDYNLDYPEKREAVYHMVKELKERGIKIDGIGMQGHYNMNTSVNNVEESLKRFAELGVKVSITELDVTVDGAQGQSELTERQELEQAHKYAELFIVFKKYADIIERVTFWGLDDGTSWRGDRFPLPFDRYLRAKLAYFAIKDPIKFIEENPLEPIETEPKIANAIYATPVIGGVIDSIWRQAEPINVNNFIMAWEGATATARALWNEDNLFVLLEVNDPLLNAESINLEEHDSVEVFIDENDNKTDYFQVDDAHYRVNYNNLVSYGTGAVTDGRFKSATTIVAGGYTVEIQIPFKTIRAVNNMVIGFEAQVNDANASGSRVSIAKWNDLTHFSYRSTLHWGRLLLTGKVPAHTTEYSLNGFGQGITTGGGVIKESDPGYVKVYNAVELAHALLNTEETRVIEIMNDLDLGYNEIPNEAKGQIGSKNSPFREHIRPIVNEILIQTGVSRIVLGSEIDGITIFSLGGCTIRHASFVFQGSKNIIIRNLEFDELWEWDDAKIESTSDSGSNGDYDRNDWDYLGFEGCENIWIDHCTFNKAYDGMVDAKHSTDRVHGTKNLVVSWCKLKGDDLSPNSWVTRQINQLERDYQIDRTRFPMYTFIRERLGLTPYQIMQVQASQKKCHLIGATELLSSNAELSITLFNNIYEDIQDRIPRLRAGNAHAYNLLIDCKRMQVAKSIVTSIMNAELTAAGYHFGVTSNACISTENGAILAENSRIIDVTNPVRNNQKSGNPPEYTGKILLDRVMYSMRGKLFDGQEIYYGNSENSSGPLYPVPAPIIHFSWNGFEELPYNFILLDTTTVEPRLRGPEGPGSGVLSWNVENWLRVEYYID